MEHFERWIETALHLKNTRIDFSSGLHEPDFYKDGRLKRNWDFNELLQSQQSKESRGSLFIIFEIIIC